MNMPCSSGVPNRTYSMLLLPCYHGVVLKPTSLHQQCIILFFGLTACCGQCVSFMFLKGIHITAAVNYGFM